MLFRPRTDVGDIASELFEDKGRLSHYGRFIDQKSDRRLNRFLDSKGNEYCIAAELGANLVRAQAALDLKNSLQGVNIPEIKWEYGQDNGVIPPFDVCIRSAYREMVHYASQVDFIGEGKAFDIKEIDQESIRKAVRRNDIEYLKNAFATYEVHLELVDHQRAKPVLALLKNFTKGKFRIKPSETYN
jgi:hypothetical protein